MTHPAFRIQRDGAVARVIFDLPGAPVNKINRAVGGELGQILDQLARDQETQALVLLSGKPGSFIAGADIDEFVALKTREDAYALVRRGQELINRLEGYPKPIVVGIRGACLGGGLEAALACTYRIAADDPDTRLGLPEVQLGIIPAAGGCQRLPRLIGVRQALDLILAGKQVPAAQAFRLGLVDELVHPAILERVALETARRLAGGGRPRRRRWSLLRWVLEGNPLGRRFVFRAARKQVLKRTGGHYPAPLAALRAVEHGLAYGLEAGLDLEAALFAELATGEVSRRLVEIFFATTALKKDTGVDGPAPPPREIRNLGVVGAGFMGSAIAGVAVAEARVDVRLRDTDLRQVDRGLGAARAILRQRRDRRRITVYEYRRLERLLSGGVGWEGFGRVDLVIEAVFEDLQIKRDVVRALEAVVPEHCLIASNTSTIPIARIAAASRRPDRVLGMHFFSPVERMPLLEVIVTAETSPHAAVTAVAFGRRMGKTVIVVRDEPGFWVNRILAPYMNEAGRLLEEGESIEAIDGAMTAFGFPVGPITLLDEVGLDVALKAARVLHEAFGDRFEPLTGLERMTADGRLGRKSGRGFYVYEGGKKRHVDQTAYEIVGAVPRAGRPRDEITRRLVFAMLNEAARALDAGVVRSARDGDVGAIFGFGFPAFRGGPLRYLDGIGIAEAVRTLAELERAHGSRFAPAERLVRMAERGERFYPTG